MKLLSLDKRLHKDPIQNDINKFSSAIVLDGGIIESENFLSNNNAKLSNVSLLNQASLLITPNGYKASKLYSFIGTNLTSTRASTKTRVNPLGIIETMDNNVPVIDYTSGSPAILLEPSRTNLCIYSEEFNNGIYSKDYITVSSNTTISPNNTLTADSITVDNTNNRHIIFNNCGSVAAGIYTFSLFIKKNNCQFIFCQIGLNAASSTNRVGIIVDLNNGSIVNYNAGNTTAPATITPYNNGWYRITITGTQPTTTSIYGVIGLSNSATPTFNGSYEPIFLGNNTDSVFIWGEQLELGSNATSYIQTNGTTVARALDNIAINDSSLIGQTEGTIYIDCNISYWNTNSFYFGVYGGGNEIYFRPGNGVLQFVHYYTITQGNIMRTGLSLGKYKMAARYKNNDWAFYINGVSVGTDTSGTFSGTLTNVTIGYTSPEAYPVNGITYNCCAVFKTALTDTQLALLTTQ